MNKTYIKRQITLNKLGFPISKDIQEYIDLFNEIIGDPNDLRKEYGILCHEYTGYMYYKNDHMLLFYDENSKDFSSHYNSIWLKFEEKFGLDVPKIREILTILFDEYFNCEVITTNTVGLSDWVKI